MKANPHGKPGTTRLPAVTNKTRPTLKRAKSFSIKTKLNNSPDSSPLMLKTARSMSQACNSFSVIAAGDGPCSPLISTKHIRLPPIPQGVTKLPPTSPPSARKPPKIQKRFSNMRETLDRIPCEDFVCSLLDGVPLFDSVLLANLDKCKRKCSVGVVVKEDSMEEESES